MTKQAIRNIILCLVFIVFAGSTAYSALAAPTSGETLKNLMTAYNGESNAHARYVAFAQKADAEGFGQVANLFRAAANAEEIHANNHAAVIKELGGAPAADLKPVDVKTTKENLEAAIKGESYERDTMYPAFIKQAKEEKNREALRSFNYAISAEGQHAVLYQGAFDNLASLKGSKAAGYYVCAVCGATTAKLDFAKCPVCFNSKDKYAKVA